MKFNLILMIAVLLGAFSTGTYASKKDLDSSFSFHEKHHESNEGKSDDHNDHGWKKTEFKVEHTLQDVIKNHEHHEHNVFLKMCKDEPDTDPGHNTEDGSTAPGDVSQVPLPAAVWLFGSGLLGLLGFIRKPA